MLSPQGLLKIDIVGALLTCVVTATVLATNLLPTGMPLLALICMSTAAAFFCATGIFYTIAKRDVSEALRVLAILNSVFCVASGVLWLGYFRDLTFWGRLYFPIEIVVVLALVAIELRVSHKGAMVRA